MTLLSHPALGMEDYGLHFFVSTAVNPWLVKARLQSGGILDGDSMNNAGYERFRPHPSPLPRERDSIVQVWLYD